MRDNRVKGEERMKQMPIMRDAFCEGGNEIGFDVETMSKRRRNRRIDVESTYRFGVAFVTAGPAPAPGINIPP